MNLSALRWIIALMGFALIGLITFQLYWINTVLSANQERFKKDVIEAMNNVAVKLEKQETVATFRKIRDLNSEVQQAALRPKRSALIAQGSGTKRSEKPDSLYQNRSANAIEGAKTEAAQLARYNELVNQLPQPQVWLDTVKVGNNMQIVLNYRFEEFQIPRINQKVFEERVMDSQVTNELESKLEEKESVIAQLEKQLDRVSSKYEQTTRVLEELLVPGQSLTNRVDVVQLDTLIREELNNKGIPLDFHFAVMTARNNQFILASQSERTGIQNSELRASLFPNDIRGPHAQLVLDFPHRSKYLLEKIWLSLVSSGILVMIIIFCFSYSIRTILRQKKLSIIKNDFINNMTHEFKTPIATISLASEALQDKEVNQSENFRHRYVRMIQEENQRLGSQVERVLQIAALDRKDFNLKKEWVDMHELIGHLVENTKIQAEKKGGRLIPSLQAENSQLCIDATHITNSVLNLLDNAIKYSTDAPNISIETTNTDDHFIIDVLDHGMGMSKEIQKHIFDKFYRVPTGNRHDIKGFGLGLSYVKTMVEAHEGEIHVDSSPGKGSRFTIKLPVNGKGQHINS